MVEKHGMVQRLKKASAKMPSVIAVWQSGTSRCHKATLGVGECHEQ